MAKFQVQGGIAFNIDAPTPAEAKQIADAELSLLLALQKMTKYVKFSFDTVQPTDERTLSSR